MGLKEAPTRSRGSAQRPRGRTVGWDSDIPLCPYVAYKNFTDRSRGFTSFFTFAGYTAHR